MPALSYGDYLDVLRTVRKSALRNDRRTTSKGVDAHGNLIFVSSDTTFKLKPPVMLMDLPALRSGLMADRSAAMHRVQTLFWAAASVAALTERARKDLSAALAEVARYDERLNAVQEALGISTVAGQENTEKLEARLSELTTKVDELRRGTVDQLADDAIQQYIRLNKELLKTSEALAVEKESEVTDTRDMMVQPCDISYKGVSAKAIRVHFF